MKTIAITVDEAILKLLDELTAGAGRRRTRSALVRAALREFAGRERRRVIEEREREIFRSYRKRLAREARLLVDGAGAAVTRGEILIETCCSLRGGFVAGPRRA